MQAVAEIIEAMHTAPRIEFPAELPVSQMRGEIERAISEHQVVIVAGETGSGKTTQLPKICLALGRERIAHTQPRRIAARTIAERIAEELGAELGGLVGYQVRFTDKVSADTRIRLMTDGILLNAIHRDRDLRAYDTIIIDEAHERSLNIDFLLGYLKTLLPRRPDLKVIITSATIDPESFAAHFADASGNPAPIIEVSGRTYDVEVRYRPLVDEVFAEDANSDSPKPRRVERDLFDAIVDAVDELSREPEGDVLVFLSGEAEIRDAADALAGRAKRGSTRALEILPLYGRLSAAEQHRVFERKPGGARRVVLATNVAETSLTVPGIRYVIDAGTVRISRFSSRSKVQRLPIEAISQASAKQRSGRSGRTSPGIAIRLYSAEDFATRPEFTEPEILRTGLASVILQMLSLGLGNIAEFPFLTPPDKRDIRDGLMLLEELGAVRGVRHPGAKQVASAKITSIGRQIARLPIEPRFARMVIASREKGVTAEVVAIVAGLTVQDVRERPEEKRAHADQLHARFADPLGDMMTLLNMWNYLQEQQRELSSSAFRRLCKAEYLNFLRVREWMDLNRQITRLAREIRQEKHSPNFTQPVAGSAETKPGELKVETQPGKANTALADAVHQSMLAGLLSHIGVRDDLQDRRTPAGRNAPGQVNRRKPAQEYLGARSTRFVLHPGSVLAKHPPETVMSVELVETSRLFARGNAVIDPAWAEQLAGSLAKRQLSEPHWEKSQGAAVAYERVTLYGVTLVARRKVQFARFDQQHARELFIRHALVDGEWDSPQAFDRANRQLRRELQQLEERTRQRGLIGDDEEVFAFYDERIPDDVVSTRSFEGWWRKAQREHPKLLHMTRADLLSADDEPEVDEREFPRVWQQGDQQLKLRYRFEPGAEDDGLTVIIPLPLLPRVTPRDFTKLVPGLREELVTALIKALPKHIRKHVVPANDWARTLLSAVHDDLERGGDLTELLANEIRRRTSVQVAATDFDLSKLAAHLTPNFRIIDARAKTVGEGKDLSQLQHRHSARATQGVARVAQAALPKNNIEQSGITEWSFGDLPKHIDTQFAGGRGTAGTVRAYPAIVDRRTSVDLRLVADADEQAKFTRRGLRRLLLLSSPSPASYVRAHLTNDEKLLLGAGPYRTLDDAITDVSLAVADTALRRVSPDGLIFTEAAFEQVANAYAKALIDEIYRGISLTAKVLGAARAARKAIEQVNSLQVLSQVADAKAQLDGLVWAHGSGEGFVSRTGLARLERLPVYLEALRMRMLALPDRVGRDRAWQNDIDRALAMFHDSGGEIPLPADAPAHLQKARWQLEELRVSLFAQQLSTAESVSLQRLQKTLNGQ